MVNPANRIGQGTKDDAIRLTRTHIYYLLRVYSSVLPLGNTLSEASLAKISP